MDIVHVLNRGVDKRKIFLDDQDYFRFVHDLFEFNDKDSVNNVFSTFERKYNNNDVGRPNIYKYKVERKPRKMLVDILAFCLMPNHYHLLLTSKVQNGIALFIKKLNGGYAKYFNARYERKGALFEGRYKKVMVEHEAHFIHLSYYIHLNPLDLIAPEWRERKLNDFVKAIKFLDLYRWSSHLDYLGKKNFPSVTQRDFLLNFFGGQQEYKDDITDWLRKLSMEEVNHLILE
ncbi:MAG: transposase [Candidatus Paceibacterota bacterium]|jgi:putative transposase